MSPTLWQDLFIPGVPLLEKIVRPVLVYLFLVVSLRVAGKRELAQLNPLDLVVLLTLSNTVQNAIIGNDNSVLGGILGATTLLAVNWALIALTFRSQKVEKLVEGTPEPLIVEGRVLQDKLNAEMISQEELEAAARKQGFPSLTEVDQAILYPGGTFCFIGKVPSADAIHHQQLIRELHLLRQEVGALRAAPGR